MDITYPNFRPAVLQSLLDLQAAFGADSAVLNGDGCPYDAETIALLTRLFRGGESDVRAAPGVSPGRGRPGGGSISTMRESAAEVVETELRTVREELAKLRDDGKALDPKDRIQVIKASVGLVEKLTLISERQFNVKRMATFQSKVLGVLDDLVPADGRKIFMERMASFAESE